MSMDKARGDALTWKKNSLEHLQQVRSVAHELGSGLSKLCSSAKKIMNDASRGSSQLYKQYDRYLDQDSDSYDRDYNAMSALEEVPNGADEIEDDQLRDSFESLLTQLDAMISAVREVKP